MNTSNLPGEILILVGAGAVIASVIAMGMPRHRRRRIHRACAWTVGGVLGAYCVGRGVAELVMVHYNDPASYRLDWGGPSLAGVLAVHAGPGLAVLIAAAVYSWRRMRSTHRAAVAR
jgi:hypothetical protein